MQISINDALQTQDDTVPVSCDTRYIKLPFTAKLLEHMRRPWATSPRLDLSFECHESTKAALMLVKTCPWDEHLKDVLIYTDGSHGAPGPQSDTPSANGRPLDGWAFAILSTDGERYLFHVYFAEEALEDTLTVCVSLL